MTQERTFAGEPDSVAAARSFVTESVGDVAKGDLDSITIMVSELATNSVRHAQSSFRVLVERVDGHLRVEVRDSGDGTPRVLTPTSDKTSGRGLLIVEALADEWGVERAADGSKTVWFSLGLTA